MTRKQLASMLDISCDACQAQLADYVRRELAGEAVDTRFPAVAYHIETCTACEADYYRLFYAEGRQRDLADLRKLGDREGISAHFDEVLAALPPATAWNERPVAHGRAWYDRVGNRLRLLEIQLAGLFSRPPQAPAEVLSGLQGATHGETLAGTQAVALAEGELDLALRILPDPAGDTTRCRVEVTVSLADRFGDYSGVELILTHAAGEAKATTDEAGKAHFDHIPCDESEALSLALHLPA